RIRLGRRQHRTERVGGHRHVSPRRHGAGRRRDYFLRPGSSAGDLTPARPDGRGDGQDPRRGGWPAMMLLPPASPLRPRRARRGLSLLEVLVSLSIFLFALIVIGRLVVMGTDLALDVQYQSQATQLCQSKMAEVLCGAVPLSSQNEVPFDEDSNW